MRGKGTKADILEQGFSMTPQNCGQTKKQKKTLSSVLLKSCMIHGCKLLDRVR